MYRLLPLVTSVLVCGACGSGMNAPPVIDVLDMPPTAVADATGTWVVSGSLQFHDDDDIVQTLRITLQAMQYEMPINLQQGLISPFTIKYGKNTGKGVQTYLITLVDAGGATAVQQKTVTLE